MYRLQKIMDEYAGGVSSQFKTSDKLLEKGMELLTFLKEDSGSLGAGEPARADAVLGERPPDVPGGCPHAFDPLPRGDALAGLLLPSDKPSMDNENWLAFCNCTYDKDTRRVDDDEEAREVHPKAGGCGPGMDGRRLRSYPCVQIGRPEPSRTAAVTAPDYFLILEASAAAPEGPTLVSSGFQARRMTRDQIAYSVEGNPDGDIPEPAPIADPG